jgi:hypothetical protein
MRNSYNITVGKREGKRPLGDLGVNGKILLKWTLKNQGWECGVD